jgi:hypothetical protein
MRALWAEGQKNPGSKSDIGIWHMECGFRTSLLIEGTRRPSKRQRRQTADFVLVAGDVGERGDAADRFIAIGGRMLRLWPLAAPS